MADLYYIPLGLSPVSSVTWNAHSSLVLTNLLITALNGLTIPMENVTIQAGSSTNALYRKNIKHNGSSGWSAIDYSRAFYIDIEATSLTIADFQINDCDIFLMETGKWRLYSDNSATREVNRAKVFKTLFDEGQSGGARVKTSYITGITALRSPDAIDTGKRVHYSTYAVPASANRTFTPTNTTTNNNCQMWSVCFNSNNGTCTGTDRGSYTYMGATQQNRACTTGGGGTTADDSQADTSAERVSNPATMYGTADGTAGTSSGRMYFTCTGGGVWTDGGGGSGTAVDFFTTHSVPDFTATTINELTVLLEASLGSISSSLTTFLAYTYVTGSSVPTYTTKVSLNNGTNYSSDAQGILQKTAFTGTTLKVKVEFTRASNTSDEVIKDLGVIYG